MFIFPKKRLARFDKRNLQEHLQQLSKEELEKEIIMFFQKFTEIRNFYEQELSEDPKALTDKLKKDIYRCYFPKTGKGKRKNAAIRRIISSFKQISNSKYDLADLHLYRIKAGLLCYTDPSAPIEMNKNSLQAVLNSCKEASLLIRHHQLKNFTEKERSAILDICAENAPEFDPFIADVRSILSAI